MYRHCVQTTCLGWFPVQNGYMPCWLDPWCFIWRDGTTIQQVWLFNEVAVSYIDQYRLYRDMLNCGNGHAHKSHENQPQWLMCQLPYWDGWFDFHSPLPACGTCYTTDSTVTW